MVDIVTAVFRKSGTNRQKNHRTQKGLWFSRVIS